MKDVALAFARQGQTPMIHQDEAAECGLACLAMIASHHGHDVDLLSLRARFGVSIKGMTLTTLLRIAEQLQLDARPLRCDPEDFGELALPAVLHWGFNHFVVLANIKGRGKHRRYVVNDPASGVRTVSSREMSAQFTGVAVEAIPSLAFRRKRERSKLSLWQMWSRAPGLGSALGRILVLSILIELFSLAAPFYLQIGLDSVIPSHDIDFLTSLAVGFGSIAILSQVTTFVRAWSNVSLSNELGYRLVSNIFRHLVRLPVSWFHTRSVGDVLTRFNASQPIADVLGNGIIPAFVDGFMSVITLCLMLVYSPLLSGLAVFGLLLYIIIRWAYFGVLQTRNISVIQAQAREQATLIETIRGITPIRLFGREQDRLRVWQSKRASVVNASIGIARLQALFSTANTTVISLENVLFIYLAIKLNLHGDMTVGMITAFGAYKQQFLSASLNVVGKVADYRMLDVQLNRIGDIVLTQQERGTLNSFVQDEPFDIKTIELRNVSFRYAAGEPDVVSNINLRINTGDVVAIVGPSGGGKTTLIKLLLGLLVPTRGEILINGKVLSSERASAFRRSVGSVMQDDTLFVGSISENISFFDPQVNQGLVERAARADFIHEDITNMPMGYESLVGDMGSALSGGQKQGVLIARALYASPQVLFFDEGTSNLDLKVERKIAEWLSSSVLTRVIVAHRPETIKSANKVYLLSGGKLRPVEANIEKAVG